MDIEKLTEDLNKIGYEQIKNNKPEERVPTDPNPRILAEFYKKEIDWFNSQIDQIEKKAGIKCICEKGCNYCCNHPIVITTPETLAIKSYITNMNSEAKKNLSLKVNKICNEILQSEIETDITIFRNDESTDNYLKKYFSLNIQCPMLDENGLCTIYSVRPSNCWTYRSYGQAKDCQFNHDVKECFKYDTFELISLERLYKAKKPKKNRLLPFVVKDILDGKI